MTFLLVTYPDIYPELRQMPDPVLGAYVRRFFNRLGLRDDRGIFNRLERFPVGGYFQTTVKFMDNLSLFLHKTTYLSFGVGEIDIYAMLMHARTRCNSRLAQAGQSDTVAPHLTGDNYFCRSCCVIAEHTPI